jgi:hypothetical protein
MPDETVTTTESSPVEAENVTSASPAEGGSEETSSAETETTERSPHVPRERFDQVLQRAKEAEEGLQTLTGRLQKLEESVAKPTTSTTAKSGLPEPPAGLSEREMVEWYVRTGAEQLITEKLGMPLDQVANTLKSSRTTQQQVADQQWSTLCSQHGLNPKDANLQALVQGLVQGSSKLSIEKAMAEAKKVFSTKPSNVDAASVEDRGVSGVMTAGKKVSWTAKEAAEMAKRGEASRQPSTVEILTRKRA